MGDSLSVSFQVERLLAENGFSIGNTNEFGGGIGAKRGLVAFGYQQKQRIHYSETSAATPDAASIHLLLATAVQ